MLLSIVLAVCLARVQHLATRFNMKAPWNGYGAIGATYNKTADAPMVYRVLLPWITGPNPSIRKYEAVRLALMWGALFSVYLAWGELVMLITAGLLTVTMFFDYWDWCAELIGLSLALVNLPLAVVGVLVHGLSRETAPLPGVVYALHSGDYAGGAILSLLGVLILIMLRVMQGEHKLYCKRVMWKENLAMLKGGEVITGRWSIYYSVFVCALALAGAWGRWDGLIVPVIVAAGFVLAKANETRVFTSILPYAASFLIWFA